MKTAGDSINDSIKPVLSKEDFVIQNDFQAFINRAQGRSPREYRPLDKHSTALEIRACVSPEVWNGYFTFAFVRHPVTRSLSLYNYMARKAAERDKLLARNAWYLTPPGRRGDPNPWKAMEAYRATDSFSSFIRHPCTAEALGMQPQADSICDVDGTVIVDFIGRFENLEDDFLTVQSRIGIPSSKIRHNNSSGSGTATSRRHQGATIDDVSPGDIDYLSERFARDFDMFGYTLES
jgi:hypothetical protein